jgi:hypothetical protein
MNIQERIDETKNRMKLMNSVTIDWQYAQQLLLELFPIIRKEAIDPKTIQIEYHTLFNLFSSIENHVKGLKEMIPFNANEEAKGIQTINGTSGEIDQ